MTQIYPVSSNTGMLRLIDIHDPTGEETWYLQAAINNFNAPTFTPVEWYNPSNNNQFRLVSIANIQYDSNNNPISADIVWWPYPWNVSNSAAKKEKQ